MTLRFELRKDIVTTFKSKMINKICKLCRTIKLSNSLHFIMVLSLAIAIGETHIARNVRQSHYYSFIPKALCV